MLCNDRVDLGPLANRSNEICPTRCA
jgi:hypothetical protein